MIVVSAAFAEGFIYYTSRTGDIYQVGTNIPINKNMKMNLVCSTYSFTYGIDKYYMVAAKEPYTRQSILGCQNYSSTNIFDPLIILNSDKILEKLTGDELRRANIRFVKLKHHMGGLDINNKNNDFDLDRIAYIDLSKMRYFSSEDGEIDLYLKPENENSYYQKYKIYETAYN